MGPMTGRGAGYCAGFERPGYSGNIGFGRGRGYRRMYCANIFPGWGRFAYPATGAGEGSYNEKDFLNNQAEFLENQLQQIKKRLSALEGNSE